MRPQHLRATALLRPVDLATAAIDVAKHIAKEVGRGRHLDAHNWFEQHRTRFFGGAAEAHRASRLEGHLRGVHLVIRAVIEGRAHVHHRVARDDAVFQRLANAFLGRPDVLAWHDATDDTIDELEALAALQRLDPNPDIAELAAPTGLADEAPLGLRRLRNRLTIGDLWPTDIRLDLVLARHAVHDHVQVQFAHASDDRLAGVLVSMDAEGWVFFSQALQRDAHLILVGLRLWLDGDLDDWRREDDILQQDRIILVAERVAGEGVLQADRGADVARIHLFDVFAVVRVHLQEPSNPLLLALRRVVGVGASRECARIDPEVG